MSRHILFQHQCHGEVEQNCLFMSGGSSEHHGIIPSRKKTNRPIKKLINWTSKCMLCQYISYGYWNTDAKWCGAIIGYLTNKLNKLGKAPITNTGCNDQPRRGISYNIIWLRYEIIWSVALLSHLLSHARPSTGEARPEFAWYTFLTISVIFWGLVDPWSGNSITAVMSHGPIHRVENSLSTQYICHHTEMGLPIRFK